MPFLEPEISQDINIPGNPYNNISVRQNNPGNLKYVGQPGALGAGSRGFAIFPTPEAGFDALQNQIEIDKRRGLSLSQFGNKYAPSFENDTSAWITNVAKMTGAGADTPLANIPTYDIARAVAKVESSTQVAPGRKYAAVKSIINPEKPQQAQLVPAEPQGYLEPLPKPSFMQTVKEGGKQGLADLAGRYSSLLGTRPGESRKEAYERIARAAAQGMGVSGEVPSSVTGKIGYGLGMAGPQLAELLGIGKFLGPVMPGGAGLLAGATRGAVPFMAQEATRPEPDYLHAGVVGSILGGLPGTWGRVPRFGAGAAVGAGSTAAQPGDKTMQDYIANMIIQGGFAGLPGTRKPGAVPTIEPETEAPRGLPPPQKAVPSPFGVMGPEIFTAETVKQPESPRQVEGQGPLMLPPSGEQRLLDRGAIIRPGPAGPGPVIEGREARTPIQQGMKDWLENKAYLDNGGNYRLNVKGKPVAPWNKEVKKEFPNNLDFSKAAHEQYPGIDRYINERKGASFSWLGTGKPFDTPQEYLSGLRTGFNPADLGWLGRKVKEWWAEPDTTVRLGRAKEAVRVKAEKAANFGAAVDETLRKGFANDTVSQEAGYTAQNLKTMLAGLAVDRNRTERLFKPFRDFFVKNPDATLPFLDAVENNKPVTVELQPLKNAWRQASDLRHKTITEDLGRTLNYLDNYFPHLWKNPEAVKAAFPEYYGTEGRNLYTSSRFFKQRTVPTIAEGLKRGLELKYENPVDAMLADLSSKDRFIHVEKFLGEMERDKTLKYVPTGQRPEPGWQQVKAASKFKWEAVGKTGMDKDLRTWLERQGEEIDSRTWNRDFRITDDGTVLRRRELVPHAPEDGARVINNYLDRGFQGNPVYDNVRNVAAGINQLRVGLSGFHFTFESLSIPFRQAGANLTEALGHLMAGDLGKAGSKAFLASKAALRPDKAIREWYSLGKAVQEELITPGSRPEAAETAKRLVEAGGRARPELPLAENVAQSLTEFLSQVKGLNPKAILTLSHAVSKPLMEYYIPRIKIGAFSEIAKRELGRVNEKYEKLTRPLTPEEMSRWQHEQRAALQGAWQHVDNVWGMMTYDNLMMKKGLKDTLHLLIAYPGWNIGSFKVLGGALKGVKQTLTGKELDQNSRLGLEYALGMVTVGALYTALLQYSMIQEWPKDWKDLFIGARTGNLMPNGAEERLRWPTYMRDAIGMATHPISTVEHKLNWPLHVAAELSNNADYYGTQIRNPEAGAGEQAVDVAKYLGKSVMPFSLRQTGIPGVMEGAGRSSATKSLGMVGLNLVPRELSNTPALQTMDEALRSRAPQTKTEAQFEKSKAKGRLMDQLRQGDQAGAMEGLRQLVTEKQLTPREAKNFLRSAAVPPGVSQFWRLSAEEALKVYEKSSPEEKAKFGPWLINKLRRADPMMLERNQDRIRKIVGEMQGAKQ